MENNESSGKASQRKSSILMVAVSATIGAFASIATDYLAFSNRDRELDLELIRISLGILRGDYERDDQQSAIPARRFAVDTITRLANHDMSEKDREAWASYGVTPFDISFENPMGFHNPMGWVGDVSVALSQEERSLLVLGTGTYEVSRYVASEVIIPIEFSDVCVVQLEPGEKNQLVARVAFQDARTGDFISGSTQTNFGNARQPIRFTAPPIKLSLSLRPYAQRAAGFVHMIIEAECG